MVSIKWLCYPKKDVLLNYQLNQERISVLWWPAGARDSAAITIFIKICITENFKIQKKLYFYAKIHIKQWKLYAILYLLSQLLIIIL